MDKTKQSPFLKLPAELRLMIYELIFSNTDLERRGSASIPIPAILRAHRLFYVEAFDLYLSCLYALANKIDQEAYNLAVTDEREAHLSDPTAAALSSMLSNQRMELFTRSTRIRRHVKFLRATFGMRNMLNCWLDPQKAGLRAKLREIWESES